MAYLVSGVEPTKGFHPTSTSTIYLPPPSSLYHSCSLYLYYALPPLVFVDTHELLTQRSAHYSRFSHWGSRDLEKPAYALPNEPSEVLVNVELPGLGEWDEYEGETVEVEVPMHLRYGTPRSTRSRRQDNGTVNGEPYEKIEVDWPKAFFLCPSTTSLRAKISIPSLPAHVFAALPEGNPRTKILIPIAPDPKYANTSSTLLLPVGDPSDLAFVEPWTAIVILLCFFWLMKVSWRTARRIRTISDVPKED